MKVNVNTLPVTNACSMPTAITYQKQAARLIINQ